ncbi:MAG TPA: hypothetical protein VFB13_03755 [Reyranella sp.]|nr:hypothetical protein [Reyranella sp.]
MGWFVSRDGNGKINGLYANAQRDGQEYLADGTPELMAFEQAATTAQQLKRSQIMRQLAAAGKLDAARSAVQAADSLTQELWDSDNWHLSDLQSVPYSTMISNLGIDLPTFWAAAAAQPA